MNPVEIDTDKRRMKYFFYSANLLCEMTTIIGKQKQQQQQKQQQWQQK